MEIKNIHFVINPAAGRTEPILTLINNILCDTEILWDVTITQKTTSIHDQVNEIIQKAPDIVAVYGGDGTVTEVAHSILGANIPLAIIPGGTANIFAKELFIPENTENALQLLLHDHQIKAIDSARINDQPFILRLNSGILADMVKEADNNLKGAIGQAAYGLTALSKMNQSDEESYHLIIDGKDVVEKGAALIIANSGNAGIPGISILPTIDITDGYLDVVIFKSTNIQTLITWATNTLRGEIPHEIVSHWRGKEIILTKPLKQRVVCDDHELPQSSEYTITVQPKTLNVLVPKV